MSPDVGGVDDTGLTPINWQSGLRKGFLQVQSLLLLPSQMRGGDPKVRTKSPDVGGLKNNIVKADPWQSRLEGSFTRFFIENYLFFVKLCKIFVSSILCQNHNLIS